jgi:hypothetical protein
VTEHVHFTYPPPSQHTPVSAADNRRILPSSRSRQDDNDNGMSTTAKMTITEPTAAGEAFEPKMTRSTRFDAC